MVNINTYFERRVKILFGRQSELSASLIIRLFDIVPTSITTDAGFHDFIERKKERKKEMEAILIPVCYNTFTFSSNTTNYSTANGDRNFIGLPTLVSRKVLTAHRILTIVVSRAEHE